MRYAYCVIAALLLVSCRDRQPPPKDDGQVVAADSAEFELNPELPLPTAADTLITRADSQRLARRSVSSTGLPVGLNNLPEDRWAAGPMTMTLVSCPVSFILGRLEKARHTGIRLVCAIPRGSLTRNGDPHGAFDLEEAKATCTALGNKLTPAMRDKYRQQLVAINAIDEPAAPTWDRIPTAGEIAAFTAHCKAKLPGIAIGIRQHPDLAWAREYGTRWKGKVDYWTLQWRSGRGDYLTWYNRNRDVAAQWGTQVQYGINMRDCDKANSENVCTPDVIRKVGLEAVKRPDGCFSFWWWYENYIWNDSARMDAMRDVIAVAKQQPARACTVS